MGNQQQGGAGGGGLGQFIPHKSALSTLVVKVWRLQHPYFSAEAEEEEEGGEELEGRDDEVVIVLRHHRRSGRKALTIDGREVHRAQNAVDAGEVVAFEIPVRVGPGGRVKHVPAELKLVDFPGLSSYELRVNGRPIASDTELLDDAADDSGSDASGRMPRPARRRWTWGEATVPSVTLQPVHGSAGLLHPQPPPPSAAVPNEVAAFYTVASTRVPRLRDRAAARGEGVAAGAGAAERRRVVERRFREFEALDAQIRGFFHGHHLAPSLPALPPKQLKAWTPHDDPAFLEGRRRGLEDYLSRLCRFPHLDRHPDLLAFLGFDRGPGPSTNGAAAVVVAGGPSAGGGGGGGGGEAAGAVGGRGGPQRRVQVTTVDL